MFFTDLIAPILSAAISPALNAVSRPLSATLKNSSAVFAMRAPPTLSPNIFPNQLHPWVLKLKRQFLPILAGSVTPYKFVLFLHVPCGRVDHFGPCQAPIHIAFDLLEGLPRCDHARPVPGRSHGGDIQKSIGNPAGTGAFIELWDIWKQGG